VYPRSLTIEQILTMLVEALPRLSALTAGLALAQLHTSPSEGEWSSNDVLAHMRSCADMWGDCIGRIIAEDHPTIRAVNPTTWIKSTDYPELDFQPSLHAFTTQRTELLAVLEPLPPDGWSRTATSTGGGKPREASVFSFARRLALHERPHIKQIECIIASVTSSDRPATQPH
jgi:hypothetical protein